jgi:hypothetical protein
MSVFCHIQNLNAENAKIFNNYVDFEFRRGVSLSNVHRDYRVIIN